MCLIQQLKSSEYKEDNSFLNKPIMGNLRKLETNFFTEQAVLHGMTASISGAKTQFPFVLQPTRMSNANKFLRLTNERPGQCRLSSFVLRCFDAAMPTETLPSQSWSQSSKA